MAKAGDVRERIDAWRRTCEAGDADAVLAATRRALADRHYLLAGKAAELAAERLLYGLEPDLVAAWRRFLDDPARRDPGCVAKGAIARALVALDCQDVDFFAAGIAYRQPEPVWGGTIDTAVDLRVTCAAGLAATAWPRAVVLLTDLLHDPEPHARAGAARAIACLQPLIAEAVLRCKVLAGDPEAEVTGEALAALLQAAREDALDFVARLLDGPDPELRALAALALGGSRVEGALALLRERWDAEPLKRDADRALLRAAALHRSPAAFDWLIEVAARGDRASAEVAVTELAAYRGNVRLRERLAEALDGRGDERLRERFRQLFARAAEGPEA